MPDISKQILLVTYASDGGPRPGVRNDGQIFDLNSMLRADQRAPATLLDVVTDDTGLLESIAHALPAASPIAPQPEHLLAPLLPARNPFCVAGNYEAHVLGSEAAVGAPLRERKQAIFFTKPTGTVVGPQDDIRVDPGITRAVDYELELAVVIGRLGRDIQASDAMDYVFGYTVVNDVSARDIQIVKPTVDYLRGKGLDTFFPIGPGILPRRFAPDYRTFEMNLWVNGLLRQSGTPAQMIRDIPELIEALSRGLTLVPGDIIATGTPSGTALEMQDPVYLRHGDVVEARIEPIGTLRNRVVFVAETPSGVSGRSSDSGLPL